MHMLDRKIKRFVLSLMIMLFVMPFANFAFSGWNNINGDFYYLNENGNMLMETFKESNGYNYYLGNDGKIVKNSMIDYGGYTYYVDSRGRQVKNDYVMIDETNNQNRAYEDGVYYFNEDGRAYKRYGSSFIKNIDGIFRAFDENGKILVGWLDEDGSPIEDISSIFSDGCYFANGDGVLMHNNWYDFVNDIGNYCTDINESQISSEKYEYLDHMWIYFDKKCKKVFSKDNTSILSQNINGVRYGFDENGIMLTGFSKNGLLDITTQASNPTLTDKVKFYDETEGNIVESQWVNVVPSSSMSEEDNNDDTKSWFYVDSNGNITHNVLKSIDGEKYAFDGIGRMKTEFIMVADGKYQAQYKASDLKREDFMYHVTTGGQLYGSDLCDLYYFGLSEEDGGNGAMKTGDVKIELEDGEFYNFKFKKVTGRAFGSHTQLERHADTYYINGLKLCAWDGMKYGVVKVSDTEYKVVNASGKVQKSRRRLIKDDNDHYFVIFGDRLAGYVACDDPKIKLRWRKGGDYGPMGYYYYNSYPEVKDYTGLAVSLEWTCPPADMLDMIPDDEKVNYE